MSSDFENVSAVPHGTVRRDPADRLRYAYIRLFEYGRNRMDVADADMVRELELRDGRLKERSLSHAASGACRYSDLYPDQTCPWCEAERRRVERETVANALSVSATGPNVSGGYLLSGQDNA